MPYADPEIRRLKARAYVATYRKRHPEKIAAYNEKVKHKFAGYTAAYRKRHPERVKASAAKRTRKTMTPQQKEAKSKQAKEKYKSDPIYRAARSAASKRNHLLARYGITESERDELAKRQKHKCAICRAETKLYIDHCHQSKKVRGLLCHQCNIVLAMARDKITTLHAAVKYLTQYTGKKK